MDMLMALCNTKKENDKGSKFSNVKCIRIVIIEFLNINIHLLTRESQGHVYRIISVS